MSNILKRPYEISIWENILIYKVVLGEYIYDEIAITSEEEFNELRAKEITICIKNTQGEYEVVSSYVAGLTYYMRTPEYEPEAAAHEYTSIENIPAPFKVLYQYYEESKLATIGSNTMTSAARAFNPILKKNLNGTSTLEFSIYYKYIDINNELIDNPFISLLSNERKIKLHYDNEWYDYIIKNIDENSENYEFTYSCTDLFINELSKNGFSLEFSTDRENNNGTIYELANEVVKDTDWVIKEGDPIYQTLEEALYSAVLKQDITVKSMLPVNSEGKYDPSGEYKIITIPQNSIIYIFYSIISGKNLYMQFLYNEKLEKDKTTRLITNSPNYYIELSDTTENPAYDNSSIPCPNICVKNSLKISDEYKGEKLVRQQRASVDTYANKVVNWFKTPRDITETYIDGTVTKTHIIAHAGDTIYEYSESDYLTSTDVFNIVTNYNNFSSIDGWKSSDNCNVKPTIYPDATAETLTEAQISNIKTYLYMNFGSVGNTYWILNSGPKDNISTYEKFTRNESYICRIKGYVPATSTTLNKMGANNLKCKIAFYEVDTKTDKITIPDHIKLDDVEGRATLFEFSNFKYDSENNWTECEATCQRSVSKDNLNRNKIGLFVFNNNSSSSTYYIEEIQVFPKRTYTLNGVDKIIAYPGDVPEANAVPLYYFYKPTTQIISEEEIQYIYKGYSATGDTYEFIPIYDDNCEKRTSIEISESNRFNIIQQLCETFECWAKFEIEHDSETGKILTEKTQGFRPITKAERKAGPSMFYDYYIYNTELREYVKLQTVYFFDDNVIYYITISIPRQKKYISFNEYIGKDNFAGFKYGINLKSIQRAVNSDQIVTKLIVKQNTNDVAPNGFCDISRATQNLEGTDFILNLDYYVEQDLISANQLNADLYGVTGNSQGSLGYFSRLREINSEESTLTETMVKISATMTDLYASYNAAKTSYESSVENILNLKDSIYDFCNTTYENLVKGIGVSTADKTRYLSQDTMKGYITQLKQYENSQNVNEIVYIRDEAAYKVYETQYLALVDKKDQLDQQRVELDREFYHKYSRFIQEGSWINDDEYDDNLYYLDAKSVLYTSSRPEVQYTIGVLDISQIDGFTNYSFNIGDKTYIEDTEFFGWHHEGDIKTPNKEEIIISEVVSHLDDPSANTITVQNYKTQFEDLFQRITATTQSLQYSTGGYEKAATAINDDGTISVDILQNTIANNSLIISNAADQSVTIDDRGITIENLTNPAQIIRLVSNGILLSKDGGETWLTGITANGINAAYLTGKLNTTEVTISAGNGKPSIIWDKDGLTAYKHNVQSEAYDYSTFIRLDQFGLYGIQDYPELSLFIPQTESEIEANEYSKFGLTWKGFFLKAAHDQLTGSGMVKISDTDDIQIFSKRDDGTYDERIKLGYIDVIGAKDVYGLNIKDADGYTVMRTDSNGQLYLSKFLRIGRNVNDDVSLDKVGFGIVESYIATADDYPTPTTDWDAANLSKILRIRATDTNLKDAGIGENESLVIYDNGSLYATNANISGIINATGGTFNNIHVTGESTIGNLTIDSITNNIEDYIKKYGVNGYLYLAIDGVYQGVDNKTLEFTQKGLTLNTFSLADITSENYDQYKNILYYINDKGRYDKINPEDPFNPDINYYFANKVFYVDDNGNLQITGNLAAATGTFTGTVTADSGSIGGITINNGSISAGGTDGFIINKDGSIIANNITLGNNLTVSGNIIFNDDEGEWTAGIYNPNNEASSYFLQIKDKNDNLKIGIDAAGKMNIGSLLLDGTLNKIQTSNYGNTSAGGYGWLLSEEEAIFNNITARGTIKAATYSYQEIQAMGGAMIVRPSSTITKADFDLVNNKIKIQLKDYNLFANKEKAQYCKIGHSSLRANNYSFEYIINTETGEEYIELSPYPYRQITDSLKNEIIGVPLLNMGEVGSVAIGINSEENDAILPSRSLSVLTTEINSSGTLFKPQIILGEIPDNDIYGPRLKGKYGLYASNVYVQGAIVAKNTSEDIYNCAGLNTASEVSWPKEMWKYFDNPDKRGSIILWAGAKSEADKDIAEANFKVDTFGNMYANSGYFEGTIITNATITASELQTATITGYDPKYYDVTGEINAENFIENKPYLYIKINEKYYLLEDKDKYDETETYYKRGHDSALTIRDTSNAIRFITEKYNDPVFEVTDTAITINTIPLDIEYLFVHRPISDNGYSTFIKENEISIVLGETYLESENLERVGSIFCSDDGSIGETTYRSFKIGKNVDTPQFSFGRVPNSQIRDKDKYSADSSAGRENKSLLRLSVDNDFVLGEISSDSTSADYGREVMYYQKALVYNESTEKNEVNGYNLFILKE